MIMVPVMMVMMISSDGATRGRVRDQLQGRHHRCAQVSFLAMINALKHGFQKKAFCSWFYSKASVIPTQGTFLEKTLEHGRAVARRELWWFSSRWLFLPCLMFGVFTLIIIITMFDDNFQYIWSLSLWFLMITCTIYDHTYHLIMILYCFDPDELFNWKKRKQRVLFWFHPTFLW